MTKRLASLRSAARAGALPPLRSALTTAVRRLSRRVRVVGEAGMTTAEYAIGTLAACGFAALLVTILRGGVVQGLLLGIIKRALALGG
jgi:hypothetical protein